MSRLSPRSLGVTAALGAVLSLAGCAEDQTVLPITLGITADLALEPGSAVTGEIVLDLEAPPGGDPRDLVLLSVSVGRFELAAEHLEGLDGFPDEIAPGESRRVVMRVNHPLQPGDVQLPVEGCDGAEGRWAVGAQVIDVAVAESVHPAAGVVGTSVEVALAHEAVEAPLTVRTLWSSAEPAVVASAPDDDVLLTVTKGGVARHVAVDGTTDEPVHLGVAPLVAARGGGVDVVAGTVAVDDRRCGPDVSVEWGVVGRLDDGAMAWCHPLGPYFTGVMVVSPDGVTWVVEGHDDGRTRARRIAPDGAAQPTLTVDPWIHQMVPAPDGRMVAVGTDPLTGSGVLMVLDGSAVRTSPLGDTWPLLRHRLDGSVAAAVLDGWYEVDLDAVALRAVASFDPWLDVSGSTVAELDGGDVVTIAGAVEGVVMSVHHEGSIVWRGALDCEPGAPDALSTVGPSRVVAVTSHDGLSGSDGPATTLFALSPRP